MGEGLVMFSDAYRGRRVLVTGDTGFKGSWLCHWLTSLGAEVSGLALPPRPGPSIFTALGLPARIQHRDADVRDAEAVAAIVREAAPEIVFHLAAQPLVRASYKDPKATFDTNIGGTVNLLEAVRAYGGVRACVVVTSDKCYENRDWPWGYRESDGLGGHDPYSASKGAAELVAASYRCSFFVDRHTTRLATARAGNVIGGGDWSPDRLVTDAIEALRMGRAIELRNPAAVRPWQHVLEPLSGYLLLGAKLGEEDGQRYAEPWNFGPAEPGMVTVEAMARDLAQAWGTGTVVTAPRGDHPHEARMLTLDCGKAGQVLGWRGVWTVATAVQNTVAWYKTFHAGADVTAESNREMATYAAAARSLGLPWATTGRSAHG